MVDKHLDKLCFFCRLLVSINAKKSYYHEQELVSCYQTQTSRHARSHESTTVRLIVTAEL